ncbi:primosomal protein DnaI [Pasteuria penetrans]|uniref:primosomal protein DnaI n=1 Tax=Pasteuria penetrans TaxID=86005 RepID=UPI000FAEF4A2|nr:primosomal protein DnaI [Pasteuria penetrans]
MKSWLEAVPEKLRRQVGVDCEKLLNHPKVLSFCKDHPEMEKESLLQSLPRVHQFLREQSSCRSCPGLDRCPNSVQGYVSHLVAHRGSVDLVLRACPLLQQKREETERNLLFRTHRIPRDVRSASFSSLLVDDQRVDAITAAINFCSAVRQGKCPIQGLYLYGPFGVGKSHIAGAIANCLAESNHSSYMFYVPDFLRNLQESISENRVGERLLALKGVDVLILDDIGAEVLTPWKRDEVLGSILQYRSAEGKPVVYTSNLCLEELEQHLACTERGGMEAIKAKRLLERIQPHVVVHSVQGPNWRTHHRRTGDG